MVTSQVNYISHLNDILLIVNKIQFRQLNIGKFVTNKQADNHQLVWKFQLFFLFY
jgi:hypothetical protein